MDDGPERARPLCIRDSLTAMFLDLVPRAGQVVDGTFQLSGIVATTTIWTFIGWKIGPVFLRDARIFFVRPSLDFSPQLDQEHLPGAHPPVAYTVSARESVKDM